VTECACFEQQGRRFPAQFVWRFGPKIALRTSVTSAWPSTLWVIRHGESAGNVAHLEAERAGTQTIEIRGRDVDVPLSSLGERQAVAVGAWFRAKLLEQRPSVILTSPYTRALRTSALIASKLDGPPIEVRADERLREKEFGSLNRLTRTGIVAQFPEEARRRADLGKFYYRPPGGESWCDVILRLRSVLDHLQLRYGDSRVLVVAHQVVVLCFRYLLENLDESSLLAIDGEGDVANCAITTFETDHTCAHPGMRLQAYNFVAPVADAGELVTAAPDLAVTK
jgi:2,3-bisphosphoglycerate-dependent phosphoglycerate mutase